LRKMQDLSYKYALFLVYFEQVEWLKLGPYNTNTHALMLSA